MPDNLEDFFPTGEHDNWQFWCRKTGAKFTISYSARTVGNRRTIQLGLTGAPHVPTNPALFDRLTLTPTGLELNRFLYATGPIEINPPLLITLNPAEVNEVPVLFPQNSVAGAFGPCRGRVKEKKLTVLEGQRKQFQVKLVANCQVLGSSVYDAELRFQTGRGLSNNQGDMSGVFFIYQRRD